MRVARLDGLRAIAVLAVIVSHTTAQVWGWAGVDLFFILSGYLITGILRRERDEPDYWSRFYIKRAARILPPFIATLVCIAYLYPVEWSHNWAYCVFFLGNMPLILRDTVPIAMSVLWSLAVEEHYYLLWPFAVRRLSRKLLTRALVSLLLAEPILRVFAHMPTERLIYAFTLFRLDGIALGSLLALLLEDSAWRAIISRWSAPLTGLLMVIFGALKLADPYFYRSANALLFNAIGYSLIAAMLGAFIAYVLTHDRGAMSRALGIAPLAWVGRISYGLYLYHALFLSYVFTHYRRGKPAFMVDTALVILVSAVSFYLYESPIIRIGHRLVKTRRQSRVLV